MRIHRPLQDCTAAQKNAAKTSTTSTRVTRHRSGTFAALLLAMGVAGVSGIAHAAGTVGTGTPASCTEAALNTALSGGGAVLFNCGAAPVTITLTTTKFLSQATDINGGGLVTLDGNNAVQLLSMSPSANLALSGISLVNGRTASNGAAISFQGPAALTLTNVVLGNNQTTVGDGGAVSAYAGATATLTDVTAIGNKASAGGAIFMDGTSKLSLTRFRATGNQATSGGGVIEFWGPSVSIIESTFATNAATAFGAGGGVIDVNPATKATLSIVNSTFQGNTASNAGSGAAISTHDTTGTINNSTFADHQAQGTIEAGGNTKLTLTNTIVSNTIANQNCFVVGGTIVDGGNNLQFAGTISNSCGASIPTADPKLGSLANNGGPTSTIALLAGSPAIDAGNNATCAATDQRGVARPQGAKCDIGAYEAATAGVAPTITNGPAPGGTVGIPYAFTYTATGTTPISFALLSGSLPPGLLLTAAGTIVGTPTMPGTYTGAVSASNGILPDTTQAFSITIAAAPPAPGAIIAAPMLGGSSMILLVAALCFIVCVHLRVRKTESEG